MDCGKVVEKKIMVNNIDDARKGKLWVAIDVC
jgi:hypothetical protein